MDKMPVTTEKLGTCCICQLKGNQFYWLDNDIGCPPCYQRWKLLKENRQNEADVRKQVFEETTND